MATLVTATTLDMNLIQNPPTSLCINHVKNSGESIADSEKVYIFAISN